MNAWEHFSQLFLRPEVMFILMLMVIYGIIGELSSPGAILPGVVGAIALILVLYMSAILPVNVTGLVLIGLAIALFIVDIYAPTHGVLTAGGIVAFFLGALMLFSSAGPGFGLSLSLDHSRRRWSRPRFSFLSSARASARSSSPSAPAAETMLGQTVNALSRIDSAGRQGVHRGRKLERRERNAGRSRTAGGSHRHRRIDFESETKNPLTEKIMNELISCTYEIVWRRLARVVIIIVVLAIFMLPQAMRILREYERGVIFRLGKLQGAKGPGLIFLIPIVDKHGEDGFARRDH